MSREGTTICEQPQRRTGEGRDQPGRDRGGESEPADGNDSASEQVRPPARADPQDGGPDLDPGEHARGGGGRDVPLVVEEEDDEPDDRHLGDQVETAAGRELPQPAVAERVG